MYLAFYDLNHDPFPSDSAAPPLYVPPGHFAAVARIMDAIAERRGFMALLGEASMGKTWLLCAHLAEADPQQLTVIYLPQADVSFETLVKRIYDEFGFVPPLPSLPEMIDHLHALVIEEHKKGRNIALVIDNAHTMPLETLGDLCLLSNIPEYPEKLLQIVLVAQPHMEQQFHFLDLVKGGNPFTTVAHLERFSHEESVDYIRTHLADAQEYTTPIVSKGAIRAIAASAQGVPQRLRRVGREVLVEGYRSQARPVPPRVARRVTTAYAGRSSRPRRLLMSAASVLLVAAGLVAYGQRGAVRDTSSQARDVASHVATAGSPLEPAPGLQQDTAAPVVPVVTQEPIELTSDEIRDVAPRVATAERPLESVPGLQQDTAAPVDPVVIQEPVEVASEPLRTAEAAGTPFDAAVFPQGLQPPAPVVTRGLPGTADARASAVQQAASFVRRTFPNGGDFRLNVWTEKGGSAVYSAGERLIVHVVAESTAYLQVDYYQADGEVVHLLPNPLDTNRVVAGHTFSLGQPESSFQFSISPPFGAEMLVVIASQRPFTPERGAPNVEPADEYMPRLQQNLHAARSRGKVAVAHLDLLTQKQ